MLRFELGKKVDGAGAGMEGVDKGEQESEGVELGTGSTRIEDLTNGVGLNPIERAGIDDPKFPTHAS